MSVQKHGTVRRDQRGVSLIISMILLVLVSLVVVNAFNLSSSDLKSVFNLQSRNAAVAAANQAVERVISANFHDATGSQKMDVDMNSDGKVDYTVDIAKPRCIKAAQSSSGAASDVELGTSMSSGATWFTDWDIDATVKDPVSGASVQVKQGVRVQLSDAQKAVTCPTPSSPS